MAEFLRRIMGAGCAHYEVYIQGRKAVYFGRDGEFYIEPFPPKAKSGEGSTSHSASVMSLAQRR
jgi:uncharacterized protein YbcV (DUF1398 family)